MTPSWRTLEREITEILRGHHFVVMHDEISTDMLLVVPDYDYPFKLSLTTFAKDLAKRLEDAR